MFPSSKTSYIEENTSKGEENIISAPAIALKRSSAPDGELDTQKEDKSAKTHDVGCLRLEL
jgi:hypothetical protein